MKKGGGRNKGSAFERKVAHMVIRHFCVSPKDCYRTPLSGGHFAASKTDPGDLVLSPKLVKKFPVSVECKSYRTLDWPKLLFPEINQGHWGKWWKQCVKASSGTRHPVLVFQQNRSNIFCLYRQRDFEFSWCRPVLLTTLDKERVNVELFSTFLQRF